MPATSTRPWDGSSATSTSPEVLKRGASESRLLAPGRDAHLPGVTPPVVLRARVVLPDTVAGPRRRLTGFRGPRSRIDCPEGYRRRRAPGSAKTHEPAMMSGNRDQERG